MERLTHQTRWTNDIDLKQEYGYKHIYQRLCEYENTGLTPEQIVQLQIDNNRLSSECIMQKETIILMQKENEWLELRRAGISIDDQRPIPKGARLYIR